MASLDCVFTGVTSSEVETSPAPAKRGTTEIVRDSSTPLRFARNDKERGLSSELELTA